MQYIILSSFQDTPSGVVLITPHSATLHVGLKSLALSGLLCRNRHHSSWGTTHFYNVTYANR
ncbi:hypothetical protein Barb4_02479 [Bacteroidales bacterium Barb4]|nr:hypothetical protein Barb4_02479 [Bacteroidales bacterium Barb4]